MRNFWFFILEGETGTRATQGSPPRVLSAPAPTVFLRKDGERNFYHLSRWTIESMGTLGAGLKSVPPRV